MDKELLNNQAFEDSLLTVDWYPSGANIPASDRKALQVLEDGSLLLHIGAPQAQEVKVIAQFGVPREDGYCPWEDEPVYGVKNAEGVFEVRLPWNENHTGSRSLKIYIDGTLVIWPYLPVAFGSNRIQNYVEMPDEDMAFAYVYDVPHGAVISQRYHSSVKNREERCMIYTPPGYMKDNREYPVLYLLHGGSDNETSWFTRARVNDILDNLIANGECEPFVVCAINDMYTYSQDDPGRIWQMVDGSTEDILLHDCIPFVESNYRVKKDKWNRAIGGLSLGALQACDIGFGNPDVFGNMGFLTSILEHESYRNAKGRPWENALKNPGKIASDYRLIYCSATPQEDHFPYFLNDEKLMKEAGLEELMGERYVRTAHDHRFTRWCSWRIGLRDYAKLLFRNPEETHV